MDQDPATRRTQLPPEAAGRRLDQALAELFPEFSRSRLTAWIKSGDVRVDGAAADSAANRARRRGSDPARRTRAGSGDGAGSDRAGYPLRGCRRHCRQQAGRPDRTSGCRAAVRNPAECAAAPRPGTGEDSARRHRASPGQGHVGRDGGGALPARTHGPRRAVAGARDAPPIRRGRLRNDDRRRHAWTRRSAAIRAID